LFASSADADLGAIAHAMLIDAEAIRYSTQSAPSSAGGAIWLDEVPALRPLVKLRGIA
jgi:hypothetical protein